MRTGLIASIAGHLLLLAWGVITLVSTPPLDPNIEALPIEMVQVADVTHLPKGSTSAKPSATHSPNDPNDKVADQPQPTAPKPVAKATPTPPQPKAAPPPPPPPQQVASADQTASVPSQPAQPATPDSPPPDAKPAAADQAPAPATPPPPSPDAQAKPAPKPPPVPHVRPQPPTPPTQPVTEKKDTTFDTDKIAALLDKSAQPPQAEQSNQAASLGVAMETASSDKLTESEVDALRAQVQRCWTVPVGWTDPKQVTVTIRFRLNPDGTVSGNPTVIEFPASQYGQVAADSATRAVLRCGPYQLPPEKYDQWSEVQLRFSPTS